MRTYVSSSARTVQHTEGGGLADTVFSNALSQPDFIQLTRKIDGAWHDVTSSQFRDDVVAVAKGLIASGISFGDCVGIMAANSYEWTLFDYAMWTIGVISVPIYPTASPDQVATILSDTGAVACIVENEDHVMTVGSVMHKLPRLSALWELETGAVNFLMEAGLYISDETVERQRRAVGPQATASIVYTSGTTGKPKGCVLTHGNLAAQADSMLELAWDIIHDLRRGAEPSTLLFLPLSHVFGRTVQVCAVRGSVRLGHNTTMTAAGLMSDLASFRPTFLLAVPHIYERVLKVAERKAETAGRSALFDRAVAVAVAYAEAIERRKFKNGTGPSTLLRLRRALYDRLVYRKIREAFGGSVKNVISGGSTFKREVGLFFYGAGIKIHEGYGLTESCAGAFCNPHDKIKFGTVGRPVPGIQVHIAEDGEIMLRGEQVFRRYLNDESASQQVLKGDWLATGDLGFVDADGYLAITGRKKDIIVTSGGKSVSPQPLEQWVRDHPFIDQCVAVGDDLPYVSALITLDQEAMMHWLSLHGRGGQTPEDALMASNAMKEVQRAVSSANSHVSRAESIRKFYIIPRPFTQEEGLLTPTLKVRRKEVMRRYASEIRRMYVN
ncbi:AMP-dependent synthetase/ligase [Streptomyces sp. NPDC098781]|uniref:AMP-dependent synthetase/ligase n=1 Tax=Streptomyces sp. NPDC098781 TaxID=3366097 RepID=UPI003824EB16